MKTLRCLVTVSLVAFAAPAAAEEAPKPGPEFDVLKKMVGNWDLTMKFGGMESKGTVVYKMEVGGLWLSSDLQSDLFGQKFYGKGLDSYDAAKKKYVGVWVDSMTTTPLFMEGTYDKGKEDADVGGGRAGHGWEADQVQVGVPDAGR